MLKVCYKVFLRWFLIKRIFTVPALTRETCLEYGCEFCGIFDSLFTPHSTPRILSLVLSTPPHLRVMYVSIEAVFFLCIHIDIHACKELCMHACQHASRVLLLYMLLTEKKGKVSLTIVSVYGVPPTVGSKLSRL